MSRPVPKPSLSVQKRKVLWGLRIYGPCSNVELARKIKLDRESVYSTVYKLREEHLAARLGEAMYDITPLGKVRLESKPIEADPDPQGAFAFADGEGTSQ